MTEKVSFGQQKDRSVLVQGEKDLKYVLCEQEIESKEMKLMMFSGGRNSS